MDVTFTSDRMGSQNTVFHIISDSLNASFICSYPEIN